MVARTASLLSTGTIVGGRYRIEAFIAEGGMAHVYRAFHTGTHRQVALKVVHPQLLGRRKMVQRFLDEARLTGLIPTHPNIVQVFDSGQDAESGAPFIAMELVEGKLLDDLVDDVAMPWREVDQLLTQLAEALGEAHAHKIVHRDLKPANMIVTQDRKGQPLLKVLDFGIAKVLGDGAVATATAIGTPLYCAPEQLGASMRKVAQLRGFTIDVGVSAATDVWAFGLLAYQMLTGYQPGQYWQVTEMSALMAKISLEERAAPSAMAGKRARYLPPGFDDWFLRCLRHSAKERFQQAGEAMAVLSALLDVTSGVANIVDNGNTRGASGSNAVLRISGGGRRALLQAAEEDSPTDELPFPSSEAASSHPPAALAAGFRWPRGDGGIRHHRFAGACG